MAAPHTLTSTPEITSDVNRDASPERPKRIVGLDTLRALGVAAVVAYHFGLPHLAGGFLGVTLFFVVSGFLITHLILAEIRTAGRLDLIGFWQRRMRRLLPAALLVIVVCLLWAATVRQDLLPRLRPDALASLVYGNNWWMVLRETSYFDSFGPPSPLTHYWSLAVEEQFYLVWPVVLLLVVTLFGQRKRTAWVIGALALASTLGLVLGHRAGVDANRLYLGTDTRAAELLIGATLAMAMAVARPRLGTKSALVVFVASLATLGTVMFLVQESPTLPYAGGLTLAALASAGLVASIQKVPGAARLDAGLVGAAGRRSYAIYLWHYPVLVAVTPASEFGRYSVLRFVVALAITLALAELTHRFVENPVRRHGVRGSLRAATAWLGRIAWGFRSGLLTALVASVLLIGIAFSGTLDPAPTAQGPSVVQTGAQQDSDPDDDASPAPKPTTRPVARMTGSRTVAVGDSLMIDLAPALQKRMPKISIDAEVGRQPWTGLEIADKYDQFNRHGGTYILGIGTNGAIDAKALAAFCRSHPEARIVLITPRVPRTWERDSVKAIRAVKKFDNVRIVDFHTMAKGRSEWFAPDGVHLTPAGVRAMTKEIWRAGRA